RRQFALAPAAGHGQRGEQPAAIAEFAGAARFQAAPAAQHGEHRFGDESTVGMAQFAVLAEIARDDGVGRVVETQQLAENGLGMGKEGGREAGFHGIPSSVATCSKLSPFLSVKRILTGKRARSSAIQISVTLSVIARRCSVRNRPAGTTISSSPSESSS